MRKILFEFLTIAFVFLAIWFVLSKIDWMTIFKVEQNTKKTEEKIGDLFWDMVKSTEKEIKSKSLVSPIDSIFTHICEKNNIDKEKIKLHLIEKDEINAFALPNNHLLVYTGLINACENEAELSGVMCHEIAHLEKDHVMNKLVKEVGLSVLISMSTGKGSPDAVKKTIHLLSSTAYDRKLESEADITAADYLIAANIDPEPFANFLYRLSNENLPDEIYWVTTHPESKERAEKIIEYIKDKDILNEPVLGVAKWDELKKKIKDND